MARLQDSQQNFYDKIAQILQSARTRIVQSVNSTMVATYFEIGRLIVEEELKGKQRAEYGKKMIQALSQRLTAEFGKGFSKDNLNNM
ncbi:DUF1016 domain-containing protein, partial [Testudinibacter sp. TR-2022]